MTATDKYARIDTCVCTAQREAELRYNMDNGVPWDQLREDAQTMMEGSIVLWKTILEEVADERSRADGR